MYYQHDGVPPHFSQVIGQYLNHEFQNRWIGCGSAQNWPPQSLDLKPLDYHVWGCMKALVYAHKVDMENYSNEFSAQQEASTALQCFVRLQVLWSHESENVSKQMEDTLNNFLDC
jgi:hypothetical protein